MVIYCTMSPPVLFFNCNFFISISAGFLINYLWIFIPNYTKFNT